MAKTEFLGRFLVPRKAIPQLNARGIHWTKVKGQVQVMVSHVSTAKEELIENSLQFFDGIPACLIEMIRRCGEDCEPVELPVLPRGVARSKAIQLMLQELGHPKVVQPLNPGEYFILRADQRRHQFVIVVTTPEETSAILTLPTFPSQLVFLRPGSNPLASGVLPAHLSVSVSIDRDSVPIKLACNFEPVN